MCKPISSPKGREILHTKHSRRPTLLILDFDSTLTTTNTLPHFLSILGPQSSKYLSDSWSADFQASQSLKKEDDIDDQYVDGNHKNTKGTTLPHQDIMRRLDSTRSVEVRSFARGHEAFSHFFSCHTSPRHPENYIRTHAEKCIADGSVSLRSGWERLFELAARRDNAVSLGILSVGWSPVWVKACIAAAWARSPRGASGDDSGRGTAGEDIDAASLLERDHGKQLKSQDSWLKHDDGHFYSLVRRIVDVRCNDVLSCAPTEPKSPAGIFTASDKLQEMSAMIAAWRRSQKLCPPPVAQRSSPNGNRCEGTVIQDRLPREQVVYVGDSTTDLPCLLAGDTTIGICMRDSRPPSPEKLSEAEERQSTRKETKPTEQDQLYNLLEVELNRNVVYVGDLPVAFSLSYNRETTHNKEACDEGNLAVKMDGRTKNVFWARSFEEILTTDFLD